MVGYATHHFRWAGLVIEVRYCPDCSTCYREVYGYPLAHLEVRSSATPCPFVAHRLPVAFQPSGQH